MQFITDKRGNISPFRLSIAIAAIGGVLVLISFIVLQLDQGTRRGPYYPPVPAGAEQWGFPNSNGSGRQQVFYRIADANPEEVGLFYQEQMEQHYGNSASTIERCQRFPPQGTYADPQINQFGQEVYLDFDPQSQAAFRWECMFDNSGFNTTQWTQVTVYPGIDSPDPTLNSDGYTVILYDQAWTP